MSGRSRTERWLQIVIPLGGLLIAGLLVVFAIWVAPGDQATGFQRNAEIMKACLTGAIAFVSGAVVSFLIGQYERVADDNRKKIEELKEDAAEKRRLVGELREVHHAIKTAQLRVKSHKTALTYGAEIRDVVIPQISRLGGVKSDVERHGGLMSKETEANAITVQIGKVMSYLQELTKEYENEYVAASLLQEVDYKWRQHEVGEEVKRLGVRRPSLANLPEKDYADTPVWLYLTSKADDGKYHFPRLCIFLEVNGLNLPQSADAANTHLEGFSEPIRCAMRKIDEASPRYAA